MVVVKILYITVSLMIANPIHSNEIYHLLAFLVSMNVVLWATPVVKVIGLKSGYIDKPSERKIHKKPVVRIGGVAIFVGTTAGLLVVWWLGGFGVLPPAKDAEIWGVTIGAVLFFIIGLADDLFSLSPQFRLILQSVIAGFAWYKGVRIEFFTIPFGELIHIDMWWLSLPITVIWLVGMVNAINWIDGLDGLAAGVCGIAAVVMLIVSLFMNQPAAALLAAALAGGALGFLRYNFNPAEIFMGDGGAYFMGFMLAGVAVIGIAKTAAVTAVFLPFLILAVPIVDMTWVIFSRICQGKSPFLPDKRHIHHRLLQAGVSQRLTAIYIYSLTLWLGSIALAFAGFPSGGVYTLASTLLLAYTTWHVWRNRRLPS